MAVLDTIGDNSNNCAAAVFTEHALAAGHNVLVHTYCSPKVSWWADKACEPMGQGRDNAKHYFVMANKKLHRQVSPALEDTVERWMCSSKLGRTELDAMYAVGDWNDRHRLSDLTFHHCATEKNAEWARGAVGIYFSTAFPCQVFVDRQCIGPVQLYFYAQTEKMWYQCHKDSEYLLHWTETTPPSPQGRYAGVGQDWDVTEDERKAIGGLYKTTN